MEKINNCALESYYLDEEEYIIECIERQAEYDDYGWLEFINDDFEYVKDEDEYDFFDYRDDYEWTEEDAWWALTDGMYGDCPSNPIEYDAMMDAMGF